MQLSRAFANDMCMIHASALAFSSMFSLVPFLALIFAILKACDLQSVITPAILSNVSAGSHEIVKILMEYIDNTGFTSLGFAGLITLLISVMLTLVNVEDAFNQIWGLDRGKAYHHKLRDYLIVIFGIPLLIAVAASITTIMQNQAVVHWFFELPGLGRILLMIFGLLPYFSVWIALFCLYKFIPNVHVRVENAMIGALAAGTLWQLVQWAFIHFQFLMARTNAIYGALSLLPVFMVWILTGWVIVLAGMEFVCCLQGGKVAMWGKKD